MVSTMRLHHDKISTEIASLEDHFSQVEIFNHHLETKRMVLVRPLQLCPQVGHIAVEALSLNDDDLCFFSKAAWWY